MGEIISFKSHGSFDNMERYLQKMQSLDVRKIMERYGRDGVRALAAATPAETGLAAESWTYDIVGSGTSLILTWRNTDIEGGFPVAIAIQYGYATGTGGYVPGRDYINPAIRPIFDKLADDFWKEVAST